MAMATTGEATLDNDRFSAEDQRLYLREPIAFYRGARDCEESTQRNADVGVAFHGLTREPEAAYRAGWAHRALRRPRLECNQLGGGPYPLCMCYVCADARSRKAVRR